jgi:hypothetical protein
MRSVRLFIFKLKKIFPINTLDFDREKRNFKCSIPSDLRDMMDIILALSFSFYLREYLV